MNVKKIREDFPLLLANPDLTYLDSAATSQKPACVLRAEREFYECHNANPLRGLYELSENATKCYEDARKTVQHFIGAARPEEIVFYEKCNGKPESGRLQPGKPAAETRR